MQPPKAPSVNNPPRNSIIDECTPRECNKQTHTHTHTHTYTHMYPYNVHAHVHLFPGSDRSRHLSDELSSTQLSWHRGQVGLGLQNNITQLLKLAANSKTIIELQFGTSSHICTVAPPSKRVKIGLKGKIEA